MSARPVGSSSGAQIGIVRNDEKLPVRVINHSFEDPLLDESTLERGLKLIS